MVYPLNVEDIKKHNIATQTALQTPIINYRDGFGCVGKSGQNVDKDSFLKYNSMLTQNGQKVNLPQSGFLTVPFMGTGCASLSQEPRLESEVTYNPKSSISNGVRSRFVPLVGCLANEVQNTDHIIPEDNHQGWMRGGYPSRECKHNKYKLPKPIKETVWPNTLY